MSIIPSACDPERDNSGPVHHPSCDRVRIVVISPDHLRAHAAADPAGGPGQLLAVARRTDDQWSVAVHGGHGWLQYFDDDISLRMFLLGLLDNRPEPFPMAARVDGQVPS